MIQDYISERPTTMASIQEIECILKSGDLKRFIGLRESQWFEAKVGKPYDLDSPIGRYELAKDICGFFNAQGGYLVIGLRTERLPDAKTERISSLDLVGENEIDCKKYLGVIDQYLCPRVRDTIRMGWQADNANQRCGVVYLFVPPQPKDKMPFLINKVVEDGEQIQQIVFGMSQRSDAHTVPLTGDELRRRMQQGMSPVPERLMAIEAKLDRILVTLGREPPEQEATPVSRLPKRLQDILKDG